MVSAMIAIPCRDVMQFLRLQDRSLSQFIFCVNPVGALNGKKDKIATTAMGLDRSDHAFHLWYHPLYTDGIHENARFPRNRYRILMERLQGLTNGPEYTFRTPECIAYDRLLLAHDSDYVDAFLQNRLDEKAVRRIGLSPWTPKMIERTQRLMGGALEALEHVLEHGGLAGNMAGGTHHAHRDFGSGYCVFNDLAVCALHALENPKIERIVVLDFDVHQGDGTATILAHEDRVLTISVHCQTNFPFRKSLSDHDIPLQQGSADDEYLAAIDNALEMCQAFKPNLVLFQAGVDGLATDALGKLNITREGMMERNQRVFETSEKQRWPTVVFMGGGYSKPIEHTVDAFVDLFTQAAAAQMRITRHC